MITRMTAAALLAACSAAATAANEVPTQQPLARYDKMIARSPFAPATAAAPVALATPGFATNLYVAGIAKIANGDLVTIRSRDQQQSFSLNQGESGPDGISIVNVQWAEQVGRSKVTVRKGAESAVIEFDQATLQKAIAPMTVPGNTGGPRPIALPGAPFQMQNQPATQPQKFPESSGYNGNNNSSEGFGQHTRRVRIIPSKPGQ